MRDEESTVPKKSVILGCGPRAGEHVAAYEGIEEATITAACDTDRDRLEKFGERFGVANLYGDLGEMLEAERPDILHIITPPGVRVEPMELAAGAGVKGIVLEKPIALSPAAARRVGEIARSGGLKVAANMQRRYFATCQGLREVLAGGRIGQIEFVRCSTKGNILIMGSHVIDLLLYFLGEAEPTRVWAMANGMNGYDNAHPAPANMLLQLNFPGDVTAYYEDAEDAVCTRGVKHFWLHMELDFWGAEGRAWWTQDRDWGYQTHDMAAPHVQPSRWCDDHIEGQRLFTRDLIRWLDDDDFVHLNRLDVALAGFDVIMAAVHAALLGQRVALPTDVPDDVMIQIEAKLT